MMSLLCAAVLGAVASRDVPPMNTRKPYLLANANITPAFRGEFFGELSLWV